MVRVNTNTNLATKVGIQNATYTYAPDAQASDSYAITLDPAPSAYAIGQSFTFKANTANTGSASLNVNGLGAKTLKKLTDQDLVTGDIEAGSIVEVVYDGTNFQVISTVAQTASSGQTLYEAIVASSGGDYTTVSGAITAGKKRIFVRNGTYAETGEVNILADTIITGESREGVIIDVDGTTNKRFLFGSGVTATNIQITNLTLKCTTATDFILDSANTASSSLGDILFENVTFDGGGIQLASGTTSTLSGYLIVNQCYFTRQTSAGGCIYVRGSTGDFSLVRISNNATDASASNPSFFSGPVNGAEIVNFICINNNIVVSDSNYLTNSVQLDASNSLATGFIANNIVHGGGLWADQGHTTFTGEFMCMGNFVRSNSAGNGVGLNNVPPGGHVCNNVFNDLATGVGLGAQADGAVVTGNTFEGCTTAINVNAGSASSGIFGNSFRDNTTDITDGSTTTYISDNLGSLTSTFKKGIVKMKNSSGGALAIGDVVVLKDVAGGDEVTTTTTAGDKKVFGMVFDTSIADTTYGKIQTLGKTVNLKVNGTTDIAIGDFLSTFTTAKIAKKASDGEMAFAIALEAYTTDDSSGVIDALLITPRIVGSILTPAGGTLTGDLTLGENTSIALDPAGSADGKYSGITVTGTAGYTQAFGDLVYLSSVDSRWELADADSATTADRMLAMVVSAGTDGTACKLLLQGIIRADAKFPALTIGSPVYVGETAGEIQVAIPTGVDNVIRRVGYALTADEIYFNPSMDSQTTVA